MKTLVVTGLIGSGKSLACKILEKHGIPVYDSDSRVKALYEIHPELKSLVTKDIFSHPEKLEELESRVYPVLLSDFSQWSRQKEQQGCEAVAFESAVILQKKAFDTFGDFVILIDAPQKVRLERALRRGTADEDSLQKRDSLQKDQRNNPRVDVIIDNSGSPEDLENKLTTLIKEL